MSPQFSIIIPVFNKQTVVRDTLQSVLNQSFPDYEVIAVNDGSTDSSLSVLNEIQDKRLRIFSIHNSGPSGARNYGIGQAAGEWIVVLDADDILLPNALDVFNRVIEKWQGADMIVSNFYDVNPEERRLHFPNTAERRIANPYKAWFFRQIMPGAGAFACKKSILDTIPYNEELRRSEDVELLFRLFSTVKMISTPLPTMEYRHQFSTESRKYPPIETEFKGHLSFDRDKSFWEKICLYECYIEAKNTYPEDTERLYSFLRRRYKLILSYHLAFWYRALIRTLLH